MKQKVASQLNDYQNGLMYKKSHLRILLLTLISTVLQILSRLSVPFMVYKSFALTGYHYLDLLVLQSILSLAVDSLPLPGAIGVAESSFMIINQAIFGSTYSLLCCSSRNQLLCLLTDHRYSCCGGTDFF